MNFINMFMQQPLTFTILIGAIVLYFMFDQKAKYGNKKTAKDIEKMTPEEYAKYKKEMKINEEERSRKKKTNLTKRYSNIYDERHYEAAPTDGTSVYQKGLSTVSQKKKRITSRAMERLPDYRHYLEEVCVKNLNHLARNMEMINYDCADDIYYLQKKGYFKDVTIDETYCRIIYKGQGIEEEFDNTILTGENSPFHIENNFEGEQVPGLNRVHECPHCGTPNIIDTDTKEYNCYYCLDKVYVKGKNKK